MGNDDFPPSQLDAADGDMLHLALLVNADGEILGGDFSYFDDAGALGDKLTAFLSPPENRDPHPWWQELVTQAAAPHTPYAPGQALLKFEREVQPVEVRVTAITGRDEYLVSCFSPEHPQLTRANVLQNISVAISHLDLGSLLTTVRKRVCELMQVDSFYIALHDREVGLIHLHEVVDNGKYVGTQTIAQLPDDGIIGWVLANRQSLIVGDVTRDPLPVDLIIRGSGEPPRSILLVPLIAHGDVVGALSVQSHKPNAYSSADLWLLDAVAGQTSVAIRNAYLFEETASRLATLASLQDTALQFTTAYNQEAVSEIIGQALMELLHPDEIRIYLREGTDEQLRFVAGYVPEGLAPARQAPSPESLVALIDAQGAPFVLDDAQGHPGLVGDFDWPPTSVAGYPIGRGSERYGVLILLCKTPHFFRQDERRAISLMANQAAIAVENAQYHADVLRRYEEVAALYSLAQEVTGQLNSADILNLVVRTLRRILDCRACVIALREGEEVVIRAASGIKQRWQDDVRWKIGEGVAGQVVATGHPVYVADVHDDPDQVVFDPTVRSLLAVPITFQGKVLGSLNLDSTIANAFTAEHERILTVAAAQVAAAMEIARLYHAEAERAQKLAQANEALEKLEQLREELIQNLAHELRTPLTYIKGYASLLLDGVIGQIDEEQLNSIQIIADKAEVLEQLIRDVVLLEQIGDETIEPEPLNINELAARALEALKTVHGDKDLQFVLAVADAPCWVMGDRSRINQVIDNLLNNAIKFTPAGGTVTLQTQVDSANEEVQVAVRDTGIGIEPQYIDRIFERFFQVKDPERRAGGSGIGLSIVQRILAAHHGRIWVESEPGAGSVFIFALPRLERPAVHDS